MSLLGVDIGSSSVKAAVFSVQGKTIAAASRAYQTVSPGPSMTEVDPEELWLATAGAIRDAAGQAHARAASDPVEALCIGSHGETFISVDRSGAPVGRSVMNSDGRATVEAARLERELGRERLYRLSGAMAHPMYPLAKMRWLASHAPEATAAAVRHLGPAEYVLARIGLPALTDYSLACRWMLFDVHARRWAPDLLAAAGLKTDMLPQVVQAGTLAGRLSASAAEALGCAPGTPVAVGGHDQPCSALGAGAIEQGVVSDSAGTYEALAMASPEPCLGPAAFRSSLNSYCHVVPSTYITLAFFPSGIMVRWFVERLAEAESGRAAKAGVDPYAWFEERVPAGPSGLCVTPHLIGACNPYWNPRATVAAIGFTASADLFHFYKGILEGLACEFALNAGALREATAGFSRARITGGGAGSPLGLRLRAAFSGVTLETLTNPDAVCLGAAILAGTAAGIYRDARDGVRQAVSVAAAHAPEAALAASYAGQVERYNRLYPALAPLFGD